MAERKKIIKEKFVSFFKLTTINVIDEINREASQLLNGYEKWEFHEERGLELLNIYHNIREETKTSSEPQLFTDLMKIREQLNAVESNLEKIIKDTRDFQLLIEKSLNNQRAISKDVDDPILKQLLLMEKFMKFKIS